VFLSRCKWIAVCWLLKQRMLVYDPPQRISAVASLHHPYFADLDTDSLPTKENLRLNLTEHITAVLPANFSHCKTCEFICYRCTCMLYTALNDTLQLFHLQRHFCCLHSLRLYGDRDAFNQMLGQVIARSCSLLLAKICYISLRLYYVFLCF